MICAPWGTTARPTFILSLRRVSWPLQIAKPTTATPILCRCRYQHLLSEAYTMARRQLIDPERASLELRPGDPATGAPLRTGPGPPRRA